MSMMAGVSQSVQSTVLNGRILIVDIMLPSNRSKTIEQRVRIKLDATCVQN